MKMRFLLFFSILFLFSCGKVQTFSEEDYRPSLHFSAEQNWTGEPTGLVYYDGCYHLYYQYNQEGSSFGPVSWGHAVSSDLIHWEQQPVAIPYDSTRHTGSGSVVVDERNTSGFSMTAVPPFIAFYTGKLLTADGETEMIYVSFSLDRGTTWTAYPEPVLKSAVSNRLRFPKVKWNEKLQKWLMTVSTGNSLFFYISPDCKSWTYLSRFESNENLGEWESSDLFACRAGGIEKWVLLVSSGNGPTGMAPATRYFVGDLDTTGFRQTQSEALWVDYGRDHYATMTFNHLPDGRIVSLAWMNCWNYANLLPTIACRGALSVPRELHLNLESHHLYLLVSSPVGELERVWEKEDRLCENLEYSGEHVLTEGEAKLNSPFEMDLSFDVSGRTLLFAPAEYGVKLKTRSGGTLVLGYDAQRHYFYIDQPELNRRVAVEGFGERVGASYVLKGDTVNWKILVDGSCVEFFGADGKVVLSALQFPDEPFVYAGLFSEAGKTKLIWGTVRSR